MEFPEAAIRWLVLHSSSNTELATLSNVSRSWRHHIAESILEIAKQSLESKDDEDAAPLLLLPSMVRYILTNEMATDNQIESYCLAWFNPSGIKFNQIPMGVEDDSDYEDHVMMARDHRGADSPQQFAPGGEQMYAGSDEEKRMTWRQPSRSTTPTVNSLNAMLQPYGANDEVVNCLYQWDGCKDPEEVLLPFGYSSGFIQKVIVEARKQTKNTDMELDSYRENVQKEEGKPKTMIERSTYAVRGATLARPEGYCLCWEEDGPSFIATPKGNSNENSSPDARKGRERVELMKRRRRKRREIQREVLPKVLNSAPKNNDGRPQLGVEQPCVQFLNLDSSHAVRLFTPPFKPSPVPAPITVFCVGIATEDGCFMSGLRRRFEMGHLYPETQRDDVIERSPICLCTDARGGTGLESSDKSTKFGGDSANGDDKDHSYNSDDSSCDMSLEAVSGDPGFKCACFFSGLGDGDECGDNEENEDVAPVGQLCRGGLGPGTWHCYVGIFDGVESSIRIDGEAESVRCNFPMSLGIPVLDGLTIGADHTFDMSLCFGQGSEGEGEGAIAELGVFKGRLALEDIKVLEHGFMSRYGIPSSTVPEYERAEENRHHRMAHAMLTHAPAHQLFENNTRRIPLRYMTKHRIVAWRQTNPVTGERVRVQRIGSKLGDSSSDF